MTTVYVLYKRYGRKFRQEPVISVHSSLKDAVFYLYRSLMEPEPVCDETENNLNNLYYEMYKKIKYKFKHQIFLKIEEHDIKGQSKNDKSEDEDWGDDDYDLKFSHII